MIRGHIRNRDAVVELEVHGPNSTTSRIQAVVDTGYNGYLTLPNQVVDALRLPFAGHRRGMLADGSVTRLDAYLALVNWHGQLRDILISQTEGMPLVGMSLLLVCRLTMDVLEGGAMSIDRLSQRDLEHDSPPPK